jgi:hypothetical protein
LKCLRDVGSIRPDHFLKIFGDAFEEVNVPEDRIQKALYYTTQQFKYFIQLSRSFNIVSLVVPCLLEEFDKDPDRSIDDVRKVLVSHIRAGDLDLEKFEAKSS